MTEDRIQLPCLDETGVEWKHIYGHQHWLERFKQYTKRKYNTVIGPLIKQETITESEWNAKEKNTTKTSLGNGTQSDTYKKPGSK